MMSKHKVQPFSIRLTKEQHRKITEMANKNEVTFSKMARLMLEEWIKHREQKPLSILDEAKIKAISETLYLIRRLSDRIDPELKDAAKAHALGVLTNFKEAYHESSGD